MALAAMTTVNFGSTAMTISFSHLAVVSFDSTAMIVSFNSAQ